MLNVYFTCQPDNVPGDGQRKSARRKFEDRKKRWCKQISGAERVRIELWSEGDLLERLVRHRHRRGIQRFFWDQEVFSLDWSKRRLEIAFDAAGGRYSPQLHIDLPVSFALEGLASSNSYWHRFRSLREGVFSAACDVKTSGYTGIGVTKEVWKLIRSLREWRTETPERLEPPDRLDRNRLLDLTYACQNATKSAYPDDPENGKRRVKRS